MNPLIKEYTTLKKKYGNAILLFRAGDVYEAFNEDAKIVAKYLTVILTTTEDSVYINASASLPHFHLDKDLLILVQAGYKVGVCDPLEAPTAARIKKVTAGVGNGGEPLF